MIHKKGLDLNIELLGEVDHAEVINLMQRSKVLLHTSAYEGFATVFSEALYAGAHVVSFCKPMNTLFNHQHVVDSEKSMIDKVDHILSGIGIDHQPVMTYPIADACNKVLALY